MTTTVPDRDTFAVAWADWHAAHEARLADPHGFLAVTALHWLTGEPQRFDGVPGAWHTAELQFCFDNTKRCEQGTGNTPEAQMLAKKMASSWAAFAANGKPSIPGIPWEPSDPETNKTMLCENDCRIVNDPEGEARKIILS